MRCWVDRVGYGLVCMLLFGLLNSVVVYIGVMCLCVVICVCFDVLNWCLCFWCFV